MKSGGQGDLFAAGPALPAGLTYLEEFITAEEEAGLIAAIGGVALQEASYRQWTAKRRVMSFGGKYDFTHLELLPAAPIPQFLHPLRTRLAQWAGVADEAFTHALIAEYRPGTQLGWHRDVPDFELVTGVSLHGVARMRLRPYPPTRAHARATLSIDLAPRSAYRMRDAARWQWQHAISPTKELRYSITFRTLRKAPPR